MLNIQAIREDFPILSQSFNGHNIVYLDNAATSQVPRAVLNAVTNHYCENNANVHRGIYELSERSTRIFENAREAVKDYINAKSSEEIIFTSGTTDAINTVCFGLSSSIQPNDHILVSEIEHNSNFLPWQRLCQSKQAILDILPCPNGNPDIKQFEKLLSYRPKIIAFTHVSNLTGTLMPIKELIKKGHQVGAQILIDGAQGIRHELIDVQELDCDYYCFSGHKIMAPFGIGVLYGKKKELEKLDPIKLGGGMVDMVSRENSIFGQLPNKLEAGTPNIIGAIGLHESINYMTVLGRQDIIDYETDLMIYTENKLMNIPEVSIIGKPKKRAGILSFTIEDIHPFDAVSFLNMYGIALRSGTMCNHIGLSSFEKDTVIRLSLAFYNSKEEIDYTAKAIRDIISKFHTINNNLYFS